MDLSPENKITAFFVELFESFVTAGRFGASGDIDSGCRGRLSDEEKVPVQFKTVEANKQRLGFFLTLKRTRNNKR